MAVSHISAKTGILYIVIGGVVLFLALFLGIRAGLAVRGGQSGELTPDVLPNRTDLKTGQALPELVLRAQDGSLLNIADVTEGNKTVMGILMPGCEPCVTLVEAWQEKGLLDGGGAYTLAFLITTQGDDVSPHEMEKFRGDFSVYYVDHNIIDAAFGVSTFPTILGIGEDNHIRFIASGFGKHMDIAFFAKYL